MKFFAIILSIFIFLAPACAQNSDLMTEENIKNFVRLMPHYEKFLSNFGYQYSVNNALPDELINNEEFIGIFYTFELDPSTFNELTRTLAFAYHEIQDPMSVSGSDIQLQPEDLALIKKYYPRLKKIFDEKK